MKSDFKVLLFEIDAVNVIRYYLDALQLDGCFVSVLIESDYERALLLSLLDKRNVSLQVYSMQGLGARQTGELIGQYDVLLINGQRIPDTYLTLLAHRKKVAVLYMQHGMYVPFMKRSFGFFLPKITKAGRYLVMAVTTAWMLKKIGLLWEFANNFLIGFRKNRYYHKYSDHLLPDRSLVFSTYWSEWHQHHYFHPAYNQLSIIGNPDANRFATRTMPKDSCCYCYQTLVEDGRVDKVVITDLIRSMRELCHRQGFGFSVKSHPRMSASMREWILHEGLTIEDAILPLTSVVFGHYSSLLPFWSYKGSITVSITLPGHDLDRSISDCVDMIIGMDDLSGLNLSGLQKSVGNDVIDYYYNYSQVGKVRLEDHLRSTIPIQ